MSAPRYRQDGCSERRLRYDAPGETALSFGLLIGLELIGTRRETGAAWGTVIQSRSGYLLKMILLMLLADLICWLITRKPKP